MMKRYTSGFTLLEISIVLSIIAVVVGGGIVAFSASLQKRQWEETQAKLKVIQEMLLKFRITYNRLPCPALTAAAITDATFGTEMIWSNECYPGSMGVMNTSVLGRYTAGSKTVNMYMGTTSGMSVGMIVYAGSVLPKNTTITAINSSSQLTISNAALTTANPGSMITWGVNAGMVPTKALRLPDDYAFDGWGRRIEYITVPVVTMDNAFTKIPLTDTTQRMIIKDASGNQKTNKAVYVLMSMGPNGHGAAPRTGGYNDFSGPLGLNSGSINADELENCDCYAGNYAAASYRGNKGLYYTMYNNTYVQKLPTQDASNAARTNDFDDIVVYGTRMSLRAPNE